jgi:hypothetical protein
MPDPTQTAVLNPRERKALREAKELHRRRGTMGKRKIVSMQGCEKAGLVERVESNGMIVDWALTQAGLDWRE